MKIAIAGGSGFIGTSLVERLIKRADEVYVLTRNPSKVSAGRPLEWDGRTQGAWSPVVASADVVINLAGENIGDRRWTAERKQKLIDSRINSTRALVEAMKQQPSKQRTFIAASAVGFYGLRGDEELDESAASGPGFLAELVRKWEAESLAAESMSRLVIFRFGVVLEEDGGALAKMMLPFKLGVGGRIGSGEQWMSWIDREDVIRALEWAIDTSNVRGVYNITSPAPVRNREFTTALGRALHRPTIFPVPAFMLRLLFGEMANEVLLGGQRVVPARATREGFKFLHTQIDESLRHVLNR